MGIPRLLLPVADPKSDHVGRRVTLAGDGRLVMAPGGNNGIGVGATCGAGGSAIVHLWGEAFQAMVRGPCHAGAGITRGEDGIYTTGIASGEPDAIALAPVAGGDMTIYVLPSAPSPRPDPAPAAAPPPRSQPPRRNSNPSPRGAMPYPDPVSEVQRRSSELAARGVSQLDALGQIFAADPALHAEYASAVRSNPAALAATVKADVDRKVAAKVAGGMSHQEAVFSLWREDPALQRRYAEACLVRPAAKSPHAKPACVAEVDRRVAALKRDGVAHPDAVFKVFREDPALHTEYLRAHRTN